jgi:hypothetical protein
LPWLGVEARGRRREDIGGGCEKPRRFNNMQALNRWTIGR